MDSKQYLCMCCMCSELKRILPSPHIPEIPQPRFVLYFSLKFGCKAVTRGEERFNLVLGPKKLWRLFPHFPPFCSSCVSYSSLLARLLWVAVRELAGGRRAVLCRAVGLSLQEVFHRLRTGQLNAS